MENNSNLKTNFAKLIEFVEKVEDFTKDKPTYNYYKNIMNGIKNDEDMIKMSLTSTLDKDIPDIIWGISDNIKIDLKEIPKEIIFDFINLIKDLKKLIQNYDQEQDSS